MYIIMESCRVTEAQRKRNRDRKRKLK